MVNQEYKNKYSSNTLEITNLCITLQNSQSEKHLIQNLNFSIAPGEMLGLVGESGSGKSLTASAILGLLPKSLNMSSGQVKFKGIDLADLTPREMRRLRGKEIGYVFQNYQGSFTPFIPIGKQMVEALKSHMKLTKAEAAHTAVQWLERVKLPANRIFKSYPHQLSGGQLQRASLATALMFDPSLLIADEPTTALDVLTGENILDLINSLQKEMNCAVLLISHNLKHILNRTDSMAIMYGGQIVEKGLTKNIRHNHVHPYTKHLLQARLTVSHLPPEDLIAIEGDSSQIAERGCSFAIRCSHVLDQCHTLPIMKSIGDTQWVACHAVKEEKHASSHHYF